MSYLSSLRIATADSHRFLDDHLRMTESSVSRERYVGFLRATLSVVQAAEPSLSKFGLGSDVRRQDLLQKDLRALNAAPPTHRVCVTSLNIETLAEAYGAAYVIEGSALGGVVLSAHLSRVLPVEAHAFAYLRIYGGETKARWRAFCASLESWSERASPGDRECATNAALQVFREYANAFRLEGLWGQAN